MSTPHPWPLPNSQNPQKPNTELESDPPSRIPKIAAMIGEIQSNEKENSIIGIDPQARVDANINDASILDKKKRPENEQVAPSSVVAQNGVSTEPSSLHASARPIVIPIQKKFAPVSEGNLASLSLSPPPPLPAPALLLSGSLF